MKAIITRARPDGSFDEVGMSNRMISRGSNRRLRQVARAFASGSSVRIEFFQGDNIYGKPFKTEILEPNK